MNEQAMRFRIGIFVLAGLIGLGVLIILFGGRSYFFLPTATYTIEFDNAPGIAAGTPVKRSGVKIGEVRRVTLNDDTGQVEVLIQVEHGFTLRKGDRPTITQTVLGGDSAIAFLPPAGKKADTTPVEVGAVLQGIVQAGPSDVVQPAEEALREIKTALERLTPTADDTLKQIRMAVQEASQKTMPNADKVLAKIDKALPTIESAFSKIDALAPAVDSTLAEIRDAAKKLTPEAEKTMADIRRLVPETEKTMAEFRKLVPEADRTMAEFRDSAKRLTNEAEKTMADIRKLTPEAEKVLNQIDKLVPTVQKAVENFDKNTLPDIRKSLDEVQVLARSWTKIGERLDIFIRDNEAKLSKSIERTDEVLRRVNDVFNDENQKNVRDTLRNVRVSSDRFDSIAKNTDELVKDSRVTLKTLNETMLKADSVLGDMQKATKPLAERGDSIMKNLDEVSGKLNQTLSDVRDILKTVVHGNGTVQKLLSDPSLYNNLNEASLGLSCLMPRFDHILRDVEIFADKLARHPELLGIRGAIAPGSGMKEAPAPYRVFPYP